MKSKKFWSFDVCTQFQLTNEIMSSAKHKGKFYEDVLYFYDIIGTGPHPSLKKICNNPSPSVINFNNVLIDINTLKILFYLLQNYNCITSLKFSKNHFEIKTLEFLIQSLLQKENSITNITYEWNDEIIIEGITYSYKNIKDIDDEKLLEEMKMSQELIASLVNSNKIQILCLRGNVLGDQGAKLIFEGLKKEHSTLTILNLFNNSLTDECISSFCEMILINDKLEEINFGKNYLTDKALNLITKNYGKFKMTPEEVEKHKLLDKERQEIIKQNVKLKQSGKQELDVPFIERIKEIDGETYIFKNDTLRAFNFIHNLLSEKSYEDIILLLNSNKNCVITADGRPYTEEQKNTLREVNSEHDYGNRIFLLK
jgi:hypothetical protein